jgi:excisionase family DNA binding protein
MLNIDVVPRTCILHGLDEIARYLRIHRRTAWRWIHDYALPAMQSPNGTWITSPTLIDAWILTCGNYQRSQEKAKQEETPSGN